MSRCVQTGPRTHEQDQRGDEIEHGELDLREERDAGFAHHADDQRPCERALEAAGAADDHDDEGEDECIHAHAQHGGLARHHDGAAKPGHEAAQRERLDIDPVHVHAQGRGHALVLRGRAQQHPEARPVDERPQEDCGDDTDADDDHVIAGVARFADRNAPQARVDRGRGERLGPQNEADHILEDHQQPEGHQRAGIPPGRL
jgi:hypothetical protein